jgi:peptidoglycan hydrolase-like protein with peptidoglycan-binding domain
VLVVVGIVAAVRGTGPAHGRAPSPASATGTTAPASTTTVRPPPVTTTTTTITLKPGLGTGDSGPAVQALQQRLTDLKYDPGTVDGHFGTETWQAVVAFQKVSGLPRTGRATQDVTTALATATPPGPLVAGGGASRVEIDLARQVLMLYEGDQLVRTVMISTGGGYRYCVPNPPGPDQCAVAITPGGSYRIFYKFLGKQTNKLGELYNPMYFNGGIAIHGEPAVPTTPASHGCVRIPMSESLWFFGRLPMGEPVYVVGGTKAPVPFNTPAPNGQAPVGAPAPVPTAAPVPTTVAPPTTTTLPPPTTTLPPTTTTTPPTSTTRPGG